MLRFDPFRLVLGLALLFVSISCSPSGDSDDADTPTAQDPTPVASDTEGVAAASDPADAEVISPGALMAAEPVVDPAGNTVTVHGLVQWPQAWADSGALAGVAIPLAADIGTAWAPVTNLFAIDFGFCVNGQVSGSDLDGTYELTVGTASASSESGRVRLGAFPVVAPGFVEPQAGGCSRGFVPVSWVGPVPERLEISYVLNQRTGEADEVRRSSYLWSVPVSNADSLESQGLAAGITATFDDGAVAGATVRFDGWAELVAADSPIADTRVIGAFIETCPGPGGLPTFGFATSNWNLATTIDMPLLAVDRYVPSREDCASGWILGAVPFGAEPTGFWAAEPGSATAFATWSFADAALPSP